MKYIEVICLYLNRYLTDEQFEEYFYSNMSEFEEQLDEDIYLDIVSTNFNSKNELISLQKKLDGYTKNNFSEMYNNMNDAYIERLIDSSSNGEIIDILKNRYLRADTVRIDLENIKTKDELINIIKKSLKYPDFCGNNWNAIKDLLYDLMLPNNIKLLNWGMLEKCLPEDSAILKRILGEINEDYCTIQYE